ncbi:S-adenosyl-L-methionine-dependent methyltransferase, partial [Mycena capillaripes]
RLDDQHTAFTRYFGGKFCLAPIEEVRPRKILDLGTVCNNPHRAVQAAIQFPDAEVLAMDICPFQIAYLTCTRHIPKNMRFELGDLSKELNFEKEAFDVVHARLVMIHIPDGESAVRRAAQLVRPGGLLLMEELDGDSMAQTGGHAVHRFVSKLNQIIKSRTADPELGKKLAGIMTSTGYFPHVHVHRIALPLSGTGSDDATNALGLAFKKAWVQLSKNLASQLGAQGVTEAMVKEHIEELDASDCAAVLDMYFCWARRTIE